MTKVNLSRESDRRSRATPYLAALIVLALLSSLPPKTQAQQKIAPLPPSSTSNPAPSTVNPAPAANPASAANSAPAVNRAPAINPALVPPQPQPTKEPVQAQPPAPEQPQPAAQELPPQDTTQQDMPQNDAGGVFVFKKEVEEVILHATVVDQDRRLVTNLDRNAFSVFENGAPQQVTSFHKEDVPVALGIVIDNSASMKAKRDKVNQAVLNLVRISNPQDQVCVVNFSDDYYLDQDFTSDINLLHQALQRVSARGSTALYDATVASSVHLSRSATLEKKVLLLVTDGEDNASQELLQQAIHRLQQEKGPTVYIIGLLGDDARPSGRAALQELAASTGGEAFFPRTVDEVDGITRSVARDIRSQYTIGYKPSIPRSGGGYRAIRVEARASGYGKLLVRTRTGYYAGETVR